METDEAEGPTKPRWGAKKKLRAPKDAAQVPVAGAGDAEQGFKKSCESQPSAQAGLEQLIVNQFTKLGQQVTATVKAEMAKVKEEVAEMTRTKYSTEEKDRTSEVCFVGRHGQSVHGRGSGNGPASKTLLRATMNGVLEEDLVVEVSSKALEAKERSTSMTSKDSRQLGRSKSDQRMAAAMTTATVALAAAANKEEVQKTDLIALVKGELDLMKVGTRTVCADWTVKGAITGIIKMDAKGKETVIDSTMGALILLNAATIGISMDYKSVFLEVLDILFSLSFISELWLKIYILGWRGHFCGSGACSNIFDCFLIAIDLVQLFLLYAVTDADMSNAPSASLFRVIRLVRLVRLLKVLKLGVFSDLIAMITGLIGGMSTLIWAIILFVVIVYVWSLLFREFFGRIAKEHISRYFDSVPRSMFTVFRCAFGDCSSQGGVPIFEWVHVEYGTFYTLVYCTFVFIIGVGLFNVISAIFVESTMAAATANQNRRLHERLADKKLWDSRVTTLITCYMEYCGESVDLGSNLPEQLDDIFDNSVGVDVFNQWVQDERVADALDDLDISRNDRGFLFDIFDCDNSGDMFITEIVNGIMRLRGEPRRSDIIKIDLMVQSIQGQCNMLVAGMERLLSRNRISKSSALSPK